MSSSNSSFFNTPEPVSQENIQWRRVLRTLRSCFLGFGGGAVEDNVGDADFFGFVDLDGDGGAAVWLHQWREGALDGGVLIAGFLVKLLHVLGVVEEFDVVEGLADFGGELLLSLLRLSLLLPTILMSVTMGLPCTMIGQVNAVRRCWSGGRGHCGRSRWRKGWPASSSMVASKRRSPSLLRMLARMKASLTAGGPTCWM